MKFCLHLFMLLFSLASVSGQSNMPNPIKWSFTSKDAGNGEVDLIFTGTIDEGWCTYSQKLENDMGPIPTSFTFKDGAHYKIVGEANESGERFTEYDKIFDMNLAKFKHTAVFTQRVKMSDYSKPITGYVTYMTCNAEMCLPPKDVDFKIVVKRTFAQPKKSTTSAKNKSKEETKKG
jgi:DsbC/DsbD-like thiol-disulfide interchange protein